jgi:hypothetical protein
MARAKRTYHNFNPRLLAALKEGSIREVRIELPSAKDAVRFRHEINAYRAALRAQNHPDWSHFYEAGVYIDAKEPTFVIIKPKSTEWKAALDRAGVPDYTAPPEPADHTNVATSDSIPSDFFEELKKLK